MSSDTFDASGVLTMFSFFQEHIREEQDLREEIRTIVRDLEQKARQILTILHGIHHQTTKTDNGSAGVDSVCAQARQEFGEVQQMFTKLGSKVPHDQYYRFYDHWRFVTQRLSFLAAFLTYLQNSALITLPELAAMLGVNEKPGSGFHIDLEDYLMGILQLASELSRLAVNSVTAGDYERPLKISRFISDLDAGFRLLNLKNDALRKRFDAMKYDTKRIEEVVYDLSIRGLVKRDN